MRSLKISLSFFLVLLFSIVAVAQEEGEITEVSEPQEDIYIDDIVRKRLITENKVTEYDHVREADIGWQKRMWRIIDVREKMNLPFMHPEKPFFTLLTEMASNGDISVFEDEKFTTMLTTDDVNSKLNDLDTIADFDYDIYEEKIIVVENIINPEDIKKYRVKEMWFFDEERSVLDVRILGIAPVRDIFDDDTGEYKYSDPLFWVYYPEARKYLAKHRVFNDFNDIAPMTWYDLFESRFFSSYIYKRSNVLDLRIKDIYYGYENKGRDRLLESERIKAELFNFEHDLWEY